MSGSEGRNPVDDYYKIRTELSQYNEELIKKPEIVVANKMDLSTSSNNLEDFIQKLVSVMSFPFPHILNSILNNYYIKLPIL